MMPFLPNRALALSTHSLICGLALLVYAGVGVVITIAVTVQLPPPAIEAEAEGRVHVSLCVIALCAVSGLLGVLLTQMVWLRAEALLEADEPATPHTMRRCCQRWDWLSPAVLAVIGTGLTGAYTDRSLIDLALGSVALATIGAATLAAAHHVRKLERRRHVRYYCLAASLRSWRMVRVSQT